MPELIEGKIYKCSDGNIRTLTKIEPGLLTYSYYAGKELGWMELSPTYRRQVEDKFINGEILEAIPQ